MFKTLLKKQMLEIYKSFFYDAKKGRNRSKKGTILYIVFFVLLMFGYLGGLFGFLSYTLSAPLVSAEMGWLYFLIMGGIALVLGIFGSVFSTYTTLYMAKDNDLLLSMPIPVRIILASRLVAVFLTGLLYSAVVLIPMTIMYCIAAPLSVASILGPIVFSINIILLVFILSVALGWVVAKLSARMKNKSIMTTIIALLALALYYVVYFKLYRTIGDFIQNIQYAQIDVTGAMAILYNFGLSGCGALVPTLVTTGVILLVLAGVYTLLSKTFISIVTTKTGAAKIQYREKNMKARGTLKALVFKEVKHYTSSSGIMLNSLLGSLIMVIAAVALLIKGNYFYEMIGYAFPGMVGILPIAVLAAICMILSTVTTAGSSISLEGKNLWILKTLPVSSIQIIRAKVLSNIIFSLGPAIIVVLCATFAFHIGILDLVLLLVSVILTCFLLAEFDIMIDLKRPNLNWTNETVVIKQSMNAFFDILAGWVEGGIVIVAIIFLAPAIGSTATLAIINALLLILFIPVDIWINKRGTKVFEAL